MCIACNGKLKQAELQYNTNSYVHVIHEVSNYTATQHLATAGNFRVSITAQSAQRRGSVLAHLGASEDRCPHVGVFNRGVQLSCPLLTRLRFPPGYRFSSVLASFLFAFSLLFFPQPLCEVVFSARFQELPSTPASQDKQTNKKTRWLVSRAVMVVSLECYP